MIKALEVKNFKSIRHLQLDCKKVNVFVGEPNTGKSNILESLGIFSFSYAPDNLKSLIRFEDMTDLFYDHDLGERIEITADDKNCQIRFENQRFIGSARGKDVSWFDFEFGYTGTGSHSGLPYPPFKFYRFVVLNKFPRQEGGSLLPPGGENLLQVLLTNKALRKLVADLFSEYDLRIVLKPQEGKIEVQKQMEDVIIAHPYSLVSDTLQRVVFHLVAMKTNHDAILIFEEPEAHAFPFYTKFLAERIALDKTNQYFISTHNPYFLLSVLEKTPEDEIGIFITYVEDYQTKVKSLAEDDFGEILDLASGVFFNLDQFLEEK
jgi:hypothetical protein